MAQVLKHGGESFVALFAGCGEVDLQEVEIEGLIDEEVQSEELEAVLAAKGHLASEDQPQLRKHPLHLRVKLAAEIHALLLHYQPKDSLGQDDRIRRAFLFILQFILGVIGEMFLFVIEADGLQRVCLIAQSAVELVVIVYICP